MSDYVIFRGRETCRCVAEWVPHYEAELIAAGEIKFSIDITQLRGKAAASGNTHSEGGAIDMLQHSANAMRIARQMGAMGFGREKNWDGRGGIAHGHLVLVDCPHNGPARYQIVAGNAGYNGLGSGGRGGRDTGPRDGIKWPLISWKQGIVWHQTQEAKRKGGRKSELRKALYRAAVSAQVNDRKALRVWLFRAATIAPTLGKVVLTQRLWSLRKKHTAPGKKYSGKIPGNVAATLWAFRKKHTGPGSR